MYKGVCRNINRKDWYVLLHAVSLFSNGAFLYRDPCVILRWSGKSILWLLPCSKEEIMGVLRERRVRERKEYGLVQRNGDIACKRGGCVSQKLAIPVSVR